MEKGEGLLTWEDTCSSRWFNPRSSDTTDPRKTFQLNINGRGSGSGYLLVSRSGLIADIFPNSFFGSDACFGVLALTGGQFNVACASTPRTLAAAEHSHRAVRETAGSNQQAGSLPPSPSPLSKAVVSMWRNVNKHIYSFTVEQLN